VKSKGTAGKLARLGLRSRFDRILHLPLRYEDETVLTAPAEAPPGKPVLVQAKLKGAKVVFRPRRQLVVHAEGLALRFFNFYPSQIKQFQRAADEGLYVRAFGEVRGGWFGAEMAHPRYRIVHPEEPLPDALTPIYPTTAGLPQAELRQLILEALDAEALDDTLPSSHVLRYGLEDFSKSGNLLHRPRPGVASTSGS
jgi:ATP-dependent DNA helicase RecG